MREFEANCAPNSMTDAQPPPAPYEVETAVGMNAIRQIKPE